MMFSDARMKNTRRKNIVSIIGMISILVCLISRDALKDIYFLISCQRTAQGPMFLDR